MANVLDQFARAVLTMNGMPAAEVTRRARELKRSGKPQKPLPKAKVAKPPKPTPATKPGQPINVRGQTNLLNAKGNPRDFRNPKVSANRQPTVTPVSTRSGAPATPPNARPSRVSPGQLETRSQVGVGKGKPARPSIGNVSGPATSPKPTNSLRAADGRAVKLDSKGWPQGTASWAEGGSTKPSNGNSTSSAVRASMTNGRGPARPSIGNVSGPATSPKPPGGGGGGNGGGSSAAATQSISRATARQVAGQIFGGLGSALNAAGNTRMLIEGSNMLLDKLKGAGIASDPRRSSRVTERPQQGNSQPRRAAANKPDKPNKPPKPQESPQPASKPPGSTKPPSPTSRPLQVASRSQSGGSRVSSSRVSGTSSASSAPTASTSRTATAAPPAKPVTPPTAKPMSSQYGGNDEPGRLGQSEGGYAGIPIKKSEASTPKADSPRPSGRGPTGRDEMIQDNIRRAKRKRS